MSKNLISSWAGSRKLPYAFTEQGIYMLMTVLKGELATKQSKILIRVPFLVHPLCGNIDKGILSTFFKIRSKCCRLHKVSVTNIILVFL